MTFQELIDTLNDLAVDANDRPGLYWEAIDFARSYMEANEDHVAEMLGDLP